MKDFSRLLIVNPFGIGDVLFTTPLIAALKELFPGVSIGYLGNARTVPFLRNDRRISHVFSYERDEFVTVYRRSPWQFVLKWRALVDEIRAGKFQLAFDLSLGGPVSAALFFAGIPCRIGYDYKGRGRWLTQKRPLSGYEGRHVVEYYLDLLTFLDVVRPDSSRFPMSVSLSEEDEAFAQNFLLEQGLGKKKFVVIFPGGGASWGTGAFQKRWPVKNYAALADKVVEKSGLPVILMGNHDEKALCAEVAGAMRVLGVNAAGLTSVLQAAALVRKASFVIANDGGPLHLAAACGVKTVSVFGPVDPLVYGPLPSDRHRVICKGLACQPCYRRFRMSDCTHLSCLSTLGVEEVFNRIGDFL